MKKYTSKSDIAISVLLATKKSAHISFSPLTGGGSVFYTDDAELQTALEKHPKYGHLFKLASEQPKSGAKPAAAVKYVTAPTAESPAAEATAHPTEAVVPAAEADSQDGAEAEQGEAEEAVQPEVGATGLKQIHIDNLDDAKEYLCDHFGLSRTKLRSKKAITEAASANGVAFVGI